MGRLGRLRTRIGDKLRTVVASGVEPQISALRAQLASQSDRFDRQLGELRPILLGRIGSDHGQLGRVQHPSSPGSGPTSAAVRHTGTPHTPGESAWRVGEAPELELEPGDSERKLHRPTISILMPTRDRLDELRGAIDAVLAQDYEDWELVVKDGGRGARDVVPDDPRIRVVEGPDRNIAHATNLAMRHATGDVFHIANDDDRLYSHALKTVAESIGEAMWLRGVVEYVDENREFVGLGGDAPWDLRELKRTPIVMQPGVFWRREAAQAIGEFDEAVVLAADHDYWVRLGERWEPRSIPAVLARYTMHEGTLSASQRDLQEHHVDLIRSRSGIDQIVELQATVDRLGEELDRLRIGGGVPEPPEG